MQAPPLVTAARLVALSQVIWGKWATQWRCRDTIETVQSIGYKGYKHLKLRVCNFSSRVFKSLNVEKQPLLEEKKREEGGLPSFPFPLLVCLLISSCSILSHSLVFSGLLQQQAAPAVGPAHSYSCQGPSCHTTESWIKNLSFVWYCSPPVPTLNPSLWLKPVWHDSLLSVAQNILYLSQIIWPSFAIWGPDILAQQATEEAAVEFLAKCSSLQQPCMFEGLHLCINTGANPAAWALNLHPSAGGRTNDLWSPATAVPPLHQPGIIYHFV